ncbi:MAG TPA: ASCH domain-containing protein [Roseiarcus sp.]|nr:ASCH domain-containing protein [Roseiarcus sp.]
MSDWRGLETFSFGDNPELAEGLGRLVLEGKKTATCWAASEGPKTRTGQRWVMLDGGGSPRAVLETVDLVQRRFDEVDEAFAYEEGEDDRTLAFWRAAHRSYFGRREFSEDMLLWCERFRVVERLQGQPVGPS